MRAGTVASSATDAAADPRLVVKAMTVDIATNETLAVSVPVAFDDELQINVTNVARRLRGRHVVLSAAAAFALPSKVTVTADEGNWCVSLSSDGKSLEVRPTGLCLIFR